MVRLFVKMGYFCVEKKLHEIIQLYEVFDL
nr:MAG TPA: hypothetical protein [Caudoviricetes sp.]